MSFYGFSPYVSVAVQQARALKKMAMLKKRGVGIQPVQTGGRKIAQTFWGKAWCDHIESLSDYANRLPRGRRYIRNGSVCHLAIDPGKIHAFVSGSELYKVRITIKTLSTGRWQSIKTACAGQVSSLLDLLYGRLSSGVMGVVCDRSEGLFPDSREIRLRCSCPDGALMCKHVAAVLYGVGTRLDNAPEQLFRLRGVDHAELVDVSATLVKTTEGGQTQRRRLSDETVSDVFGIDLSDKQSNVRRQGGHKKIPKKDLVVTRSSHSKGRHAKSGAAKGGQGGKQGASYQTPKRHKSQGGRASRQQAVSKRQAKGDKGVMIRRTHEEGASSPSPSAFPERLTGVAVRKHRKSLNMTQATFAKAVGVTASAVSQWEAQGRRILHLREQTLRALRKRWR